MQDQFIISINHPLFRNHRVYGEALLPGLAYIDMLYQLFRENGYDYTRLELRNLTIYNPLAVGEDYQVRLNLQASPSSEGSWQIRVEGQEEYQGKISSDKKLYVTAEMHPREAVVFEETLEAELFKQSAQRKVNLDEVYQQCRLQELVHTGFMKAEGMIYEGEGSLLMELSLGEEALPSAADLMFHPTLIDGSGVGSAGLFSSLVQGEQRLFLPLFYESFCASELLQKQCITRIQTASVQRKKELLSLTMEFFNEAGKKVAELKNFSNKLVREAALINPNRKELPYSSERALSNEHSFVPLFQAIYEANDIYKAPSDKAEFFLRQLLAERLKKPVNQIKTEVGYYEMGLDSPGLLEVVRAIETKIGMPLSPTLLFEYTTIAELSAYLSDHYSSQFDQPLNLQENLKSQKSEMAALAKSSIIPKGKDEILHQSSHAPIKPSMAEEIAIIGLAGRYPGAKNIEEFWKNLRDGKDSITEIPADRWDHRLSYEEAKDMLGKPYCKWGGFMDDVDKFDPLFFNLSPREAEVMDPQVRVFLETIWNLLESTGYTRETLQRQYQAKVGLFVGSMSQQYQSFHTDLIKESIIALHSYSYIANRLSYFFNFQGPSIAIDTMCSSSLIAIHMACESLKKGECRVAIAGGVNLSIHPKKYLGLSLIQMLGSHSDSRSFGDGDGFIPAEGVGAVLLKPLSKAIQEGDQILAIIKSTATNHGGHTNGYSIPSPQAQAQLIEENFIKSGIDPRTISYVEAAANGSALGDPIEVAALNKVFQKFSPDQQFCAIGSVKSNIGHAEAASGISQLTKVVLQLQHEQLVPSIKANPLNPNINFSNTPFYLQRELKEWKRPVLNMNGEERTYPRRATINSFGAGGSNAHLIVEEYIATYQETEPMTASIQPQIVVLSAKEPERLQVVVKQMLDFIESEPNLSLANLAYTLQVGREALRSRLSLVVNTKEELIRGLKEYLQAVKDETTLKTSVVVFAGDADEETSEISSFLSGKTGEAVISALIAEKNLDKIALCWAKGSKIGWELLHQEGKVKKISLPTYPFIRRRCWIETQAEARTTGELNTTERDTKTTLTSSDTLVLDIISGMLGMAATELNLHKSLDQYGLDSIFTIQLLQQLQNQVDPSIDLIRLKECRTLQDIINLMPTKRVSQSNVSQKSTGAFTPAIWPQFPELIRLNQGIHGKPVFWLHPVMGGVESYHAIAQKSQRPFYGIQARGWMTNRSPLRGIQAMVAYYIHIIQSVQPEGPYDLGGYSLGGLLAYEITRQLQELGQSVNSIVMLDSIYNTELKMEKLVVSHKAAILQAVNMMLFSTILQEPGKIAQTLIHRDEVDVSIEDKVFWEQVIALANTRGLIKTEDQLHALVKQSAKVQQGYDFDNYLTTPLLTPQEVTCYFFRNKSGLFYGELEPYFTLTAHGGISLNHINYWKEWEQQLPNFHMMDMDSPNHMMMLSEAKVYETIIEFCEALYSEKGISEEFLQYYKQKVRKSHGIKTLPATKKKAAEKVLKKATV